MYEAILRANCPKGWYRSSPVCQMAGCRKPHAAASGRLPEIANGCFVEAKLEKTVAMRRATFEKPDGRVWVGSTRICHPSAPLEAARQNQSTLFVAVVVLRSRILCVLPARSMVKLPLQPLSLQGPLSHFTMLVAASNT